MQNVLEQVDNCIIVINNLLTIKYCNKKALKRLGFNLSELINVHINNGKGGKSVT